MIRFAQRSLGPAALLAAQLLFAHHAARAAAPDLPSADSILQRYIDVTGGAKAYDSIKTEVATGTFTMAAAGIKGTITSYSSAPNLAYAVIDLAGVGKLEEGTDGKIAWENSALQGARIKSGDEAADTLLEAAMDLHTNWKKYFKSAEVTGTEEVQGKLCYKVLVTPFQGAPDTRFYEKDSGLLVKEAGTHDSQMGKVPAERLIGDYRKQGDLLIPFHTTESVAGQSFETQLDKVELNVPIPASRFAVPAEVQALRK